jgi:phage gp36-like protein
MAQEYVALVTQAEIEQRLSARVLAQVYDDDNDGVADTNNISRLVEDASSYVLEFYYGNYTAIPDETDLPPALRRLALDAAHAYMALRHPEYVRADGSKMFERVDKELKRMREAVTTVVKSPPAPPANVGGEVGSIGANAPYVPPTSFTADLGDYA